MKALLKDAWTLAIETLSWIEMQKLSERLALARTVRQLNISDPNAIRYAYGLVCETVRRRNLIDKFANSVLKPKTISEFSMGVQAFLRLYVYQTRIAKRWTEIDLEEAERIIAMGYYLGIGGVLTFKNSGLREVLQTIDLKHLLMETDSPYLAPVPFRGKRNESSYIPIIGSELAKVKNLSEEQVADATTQNARDLFGF